MLYLSWRVTEGENLRDKQDRLYAAFEPSLVLSELAAATTLLDEEPVSASSGKRIHRVVVRKASLATCHRKKAPPGRGETGRGLDVRPPLQQAGRRTQILYSIT